MTKWILVWGITAMAQMWLGWLVISGRSTLGYFLPGETRDSLHGDSRVKVTEPASNRRSKMARAASCVWDT